MSVKNYAPELLQIFKVASQKEFKFDCKTSAKARALRWRLNALRREMRKESHWLVNIAEGVVFQVRESFLIAKPPDSEILPELKEALTKAAEDGSINIDFLTGKAEARFESNEGIIAAAFKGKVKKL